MRRALLLFCLAVAGCTCRKTESAPTPASAPRLRTVDAHTHFGPDAAPRIVELMDTWGLDVAVNLSGGWPGAGLEESLATARRFPGRIVVFATPPLERAAAGDPSMQQVLHELVEAKRQGARGLKVFKALGLSLRGPDGALLAVDDPALDPLFELAGALGLPVSIHTGDPVAFWQPTDASNERFDELSAHPGWSYAGRDVPSWEALFGAFERRVARHPKTTFIGVHFGNAPEFPQRVAALLEKHPNLYVDTAARVPELGRHDPAKMRALFVRFQDRILFGTDLQVGARDHLLLGSGGLSPPGPADVRRFFTATRRYFETSDRAFAHPTPIQGRWTIDALGLPRDVLAKLYAKNADALLGL